MIFLHTSDWHIGHKLVGREREDEFLYVFDQLLAAIEKHQVDVLIVSGDIFDMAYPTTQATRMYYDLLFKLRSTCLKKVVIIGGNHDSISTLHAPRELLSLFDVHVVADLYEDARNQLIEFAPNGKTKAVIIAIPFLRERHLRKSGAGETISERTESYIQGFHQLYQTFGLMAEEYRNQQIPVIATGHFTAFGSQVSDTEREVMVGNLNMVSVDAFVEKFDYLALGHLHKPQRVGSKGLCCYPGSLLPMSFSEAELTHYFIVGKCNTNQPPHLEWIPIENPRKLISLKGSPDELTEKFNHADTLQTSFQPWFDVVIQLPTDNPADMLEAEQWIRNFEHLAILKYKFEFLTQSHTSINWTSKNLSELSVEEVFVNLLNERNFQQEADEMKELFHALYQETIQNPQ